MNSHSNKPLSCRCSQGGHQLFSHPPLASEKLFKFIIIYKVNTHNAKVSLWCGSVFEASVTYIADIFCVRWGRDRLGNYPCLMNTKIRIWLKSTEMARQQVRDAPGELWAAQIYPQAFLKIFFFFFWISIVGSFEPRMLLALKASPSPSPSAWHDASGQLSASEGVCHGGQAPASTVHRAGRWSVCPVASGHTPSGKF